MAFSKIYQAIAESGIRDKHELSALVYEWMLTMLRPGAARLPAERGDSLQRQAKL